jgi:hypothetical protein
MYQNLQICSLHKTFNTLQSQFGDGNLLPIYGAGNIQNPDLMLVFMNPTGRNVASEPSWEGIRAPWIGTKQVWDLYQQIKANKPHDWTASFAEQVYRNVADNSLYVTNLAKCTLHNARPVSDAIYRKYLDIMLEEIVQVNPEKIISFGNQVSSILLGRRIKVSDYTLREAESIEINKQNFSVFPTYYSVGQGRRNMPLAIERIKSVMEGDREW